MLYHYRGYYASDYYVKYTEWAQYEVVFEDSGLEDLSILDCNDILAMVKDTQINVSVES